MTACPLAEWDPLGPQTALRMDSQDIVCLHTMAGSFDGTNSYFHRDGYGGTESHFGLAGSGRLKQWQDLDFRADANFEGNRRVISIETADMGESFPAWSSPDVPAWTPAQINKLVELIRWLCDRYSIPKQLVPDSQRGRRGIAYHRQGIDGNFPPPYLGRQGVGEHWSTTTGKPCPGDRRIRQLIEIVIPRVRGEEDDVDETTFKRWTREVLNEGTGKGQTSWAGTSRATLDTAQHNAQQLAAVRAAVTGLAGADVDEAKLAAELAPLLPDQMHALSDADVARIAEAAADENARRQAE